MSKPGTGSPLKTIRWPAAREALLVAVYARAQDLGVVLADDAAALAWAMAVAAQASAAQARRVDAAAKR